MKIVVFDLDETLGYFTEFSMLWDSLIKYLKLKGGSVLTQNDFNEILDLFPEFLRPNIINILNYLKTKKNNNSCNKVMIYTNNNGARKWCNQLIGYFEEKIKYKLIDQVIAAFKINGKQIEMCRTTYNKTHNDLIRCTKLPSNTEICFIDDTFYPEMSNEYVYYINVKPYYYVLKLEEMIDRFKYSNIGKRLINTDDFEKVITDIFLAHNFNHIYKNSKEYQLDKIIGKQIISHLQGFFNDKSKKSKTIKNQKSKTIKNQKNKTQKIRINFE